MNSLKKQCMSSCDSCLQCIINQSLLILYFIYLVLSVVSNSPIITKSKELFATWDEEFPVSLIIQGKDTKMFTLV